jgi:hypothetical protein
MPVTRPETESLATYLEREPALPAARVLDIVGQIGFGLQLLHDQGRAHGAVAADAIALHDDGAVTLQSSPPSVIASPAAMAADLAALGRVARAALTTDADTDPSVGDFLDRLAEPPRGTTLEAGDVARTALAMAAGPVPAPPRQAAAATTPDDESAVDPEQRRVRNRFIAVGVGVVLIGLVVLKACGGGGHSVPRVTGETYAAAASSLRANGFVPRERTAPTATGQLPGLVVAQSPAAGSRPRAGSTVTLTVAR